MSFHLRPVSDNSPSPSPTTSTTPPSHSPASKGHSVILPSSASHSTGIRPRRPLSPSSLRDVDLNHTPDTPTRKYAAPLTGHDLMAMFPPAPPEIFPGMQTGPTSGYFQRQERAFFAQAGREIVRVRVEVDLQNSRDSDSISSKSRMRDGVPPRTWPPHAPHHSPQLSPSSVAPVLYPHPPNSRPTRPTIITSYPIASQSPSSQHPPNLHPPTLRTPPQDATQSGAPKSEFPTEEFDADEAWRKPMPYAERRRAGKHTRRVVVRP